MPWINRPFRPHPSRLSPLEAVDHVDAVAAVLRAAALTATGLHPLDAMYVAAVDLADGSNLGRIPDDCHVLCGDNADDTTVVRPERALTEAEAAWLLGVWTAAHDIRGTDQLALADRRMHMGCLLSPMPAGTFARAGHGFRAHGDWPECNGLSLREYVSLTVGAS